ncbi:MAG: hypothetical protein RIB84_06780 [Sneathiellaceae bacterium]
MTRHPRWTARRTDALILAIGAGGGVLLGLSIDRPALGGLGETAGDYLLAPLIAAVNFGISCF